MILAFTTLCPLVSAVCFEVAGTARVPPFLSSTEKKASKSLTASSTFAARVFYYDKTVAHVIFWPHRITDYTSRMVGTQRQKVSWLWRATSSLFSCSPCCISYVRSQIVSYNVFCSEVCLLNDAFLTLTTNGKSDHFLSSIPYRYTEITGVRVFMYACMCNRRSVEAI